MSNRTVSWENLRTQKRKGPSWLGGDSQEIVTWKGGEDRPFPLCREAQTAHCESLPSFSTVNSSGAGLGRTF